MCVSPKIIYCNITYVLCTWNLLRRERIGMLKLVIFFVFSFTLILKSGKRWRSWLGHCAASRKDVGSFPDGLIGIFHWLNPSGRTMALGPTQVLSEMSTRGIS